MSAAADSEQRPAATAGVLPAATLGPRGYFFYQLQVAPWLIAGPDVYR